MPYSIITELSYNELFKWGHSNVSGLCIKIKQIVLLLIGCSIDLRLVLTAQSFLPICFQANYFWSGFNPFKKILLRLLLWNLLQLMVVFEDMFKKLFLWIFFSYVGGQSMHKLFPSTSTSSIKDSNNIQFTFSNPQDSKEIPNHTR